MAYLTNVLVSFFVPANTNDKDYDTSVTAQLRSTDLDVLASLGNFAGNVAFPDNASTYGPFQLNLTAAGRATTKENLVHGNLQIYVRTVGNDTWVFAPILTMHFSDGSQSTKNNFSARVVDQDGRTAEIVF